VVDVPSSADVEVDIHPSIGTRIYAYTFSALWLGFFGAVVISNLADGRSVGPGAVVVVALFVAPAAFLAVTMHRVSIRSEGSVLVVRGQVSTRRYDASEIEDFRTATLGGRPACIFLAMHDGRLIQLSLTSQTFWGVGRARVDERQATLRSWLRAARITGVEERSSSPPLR